MMKSSMMKTFGSLDQHHAYNDDSQDGADESERQTKEFAIKELGTIFRDSEDKKKKEMIMNAKKKEKRGEKGGSYASKKTS